MTVRLRGHHLLCLLSYVGRGYTPQFVANYDAIAARLTRGEDVSLVTGPDDICAPLLPDAGAHCRKGGAAARDAAAVTALADLLGRPLAPGARLVLDRDTIAAMRAAFRAGTIRGACIGCEWAALCSTVAAGGFGRARLSPPGEKPANPHA